MSDRCFLALLNDVISVRRPEVGVSTFAAPQTPVYAPLTDHVPCCIQPVSDSLKDSVAGALEAATHVAYMEPVSVAVGDLFVEGVWATTLAEEASAGQQAVALVEMAEAAAWGWIEVGAGSGSELAQVASVSDAELALTAPLRVEHPEGDRVRGVRVFEVTGVQDEAGAAHHLRAELRQLVV